MYMHQSLEQHNYPLWTAATLAVLLHIVLLQQSFAPVQTPSLRDKPLSLVLVKQANEERDIELTQPKPDHIAPPLITENSQLEPETAQQTAREKKPLPYISSLDIQGFSEQQAKQTDQYNKQLHEFKRSFIDTSAKEKNTSNYQTFISTTGDIHVITKLANKPVCYTQTNQFSQDDFGFNLAMFYACGNRGKNKNFKLE